MAKNIYRQDNQAVYTANYAKHARHMTSERLHEKCEIAEELASRDNRIDWLEREHKRLDWKLRRQLDWCCQLVLKHGYATGHAKNVEELVTELISQLEDKDRKEKPPAND